jgi:glucokinase
MGNIYILGIDIGGTNIKAGIVNIEGDVLCKNLTIPTQAQNSLSNAVDRVYSAVLEMLKPCNLSENNLIGIGIGIPGIIDPKTNILIKSPNLKKWEGEDIKGLFSHRFKLPVFIDNDANAFTSGEYWFGSKGQYRNMICLTLGTGVGGGVIIDGKILLGADGAAAELGHITVDPNGLKCGCGNVGCLEAYAGANGIVKRAENEFLNHPKSSLNHILSKGEKITPKIIFEHAEKGDSYAKYILSETGRYLGITIGSLLHIFNPEIIVFGGEVSRARKFIFPSIQSEIEKRAFQTHVKRVRLEVSTLGQDAGIIGAASGFIINDELLSQKT